MLRALLTAALALAALMAGAFPNDASAGGWRGRPYRDGGAVLYPGWGYYSFPWGYVIPTAPYAYPVVYNCLRRYPVPRPWGVGWREAWPVRQAVRCALRSLEVINFMCSLGSHGRV